MGMAFMSSCTFKDMSHMTFAPIHTPYRTNKVHSDWSMWEGMKIYFPLRFDPHIVNFTAIVSQIYMTKFRCVGVRSVLSHLVSWSKRPV